MTQKKLPYNRFAFFHQNEALLYQFFLHECITTCFLLKKTPSFDLFEQLVGKYSSHWYRVQGHLPKMLHYYELQKANFEEKPLMKTLGQTLERAYLTGQMCAKLIKKDSKEHKKPFQQLKREIKKVGKLLFDLLPQYQDNPQVLYFVLCRHEQLDALYGESVVAKLFNSLFSGGLPEVEAFLCEKFARKGFNHLLPNIQKQLEMLNNG